MKSRSLVALLAILASPVLAPLTAEAQRIKPTNDSPVAIRWNGYTIVPGVLGQEVRPELRLEAIPKGAAGYFWTQFKGRVTQDRKAEVSRSGASIVAYAPRQALILRMSAEVRDRVAALPTVRWVGIYQPAHRISQRLVERVTSGVDGAEAHGLAPRIRKRGSSRPGEQAPILQLAVSLFMGETADRGRSMVEALGGRTLQVVEGDSRTLLIVVLPRNKLFDLAKASGVMWIEEYRLPTLGNDVSGIITGVPRVHGAPLGLDATDQIVAVADSGLDHGAADETMHEDLAGRVIGVTSGPVNSQLCVTNDGENDGAADLETGHGTHVAGSVLGSGALSNGRYAGVAPKAKLFFQALEQWTEIDQDSLFCLIVFGPGSYELSGIPADLGLLLQEAYDAGARVHSNSWGNANSDGDYSFRARQIDEFVFGHPDMVVVFAAGNSGRDRDAEGTLSDGTVSSPSTARNAIAVGASETDRSDITNTYPQRLVEFPPDSGNYHPRFPAVIDADRMADNPSGLAGFSGRGPTVDGRIKPDIVAPGTYVASVRSTASPNSLFFSDDMESAANGWEATGSWALGSESVHSGSMAWHDSPGGPYAPDSDTTLTSPVIDLSGGGRGYRYLQFWYRHDLGEGDKWSLELSTNGGITWSSTGIEFSGGESTDWETFSSSMVGFNDEDNLRFRFHLVADGDGSTGDGLFIDDFRIVEGAFGNGLLVDHGLVAPDESYGEGYMFFSGTSMAAPQVAGAAALVRQYYKNRHGLDSVSAALVRATLINGAVDMSPGQYAGQHALGPRPSFAQGWGRLDVVNSLRPADGFASLNFVDERDGVQTDELNRYQFDVTDASVPISVTMVYHDFGFFGPELTNQLDLTLVAPDGSVFYPNGLDGPDSINNVEQIVVPAAQAMTGTYEIVVNGTDVPWGAVQPRFGAQPYALVWSAGTLIPVRHCGVRPWLCKPPISMGRELIQIQCDFPDCIVIDPLPSNCLVKFDCPGCRPGGLCPPFYNITLNGLGDAWRVGLFDGKGRPVPHENTATRDGRVISFRPDADAYISGQIGNYMLAFQLTPEGKPGEIYDIKTSLKVSDGPVERKGAVAK